jgi:aminopeptidase N
MCDATTDSYRVLKSTGDHNYPKTFCKLEVNDFTDSAFVQVTHNWVPPDPFKEPVPGLTLSDYRYWRIAGVVPESFSIKAYFFYGVNGYLDNTLITGPTDSVVILYRKDATEDWQEIEFEQLGPWNVGNLIVDNIQMGEYTLAVWDTQVGSGERELPETANIKIFPNPSEGLVHIDLTNMFGSNVIIYDSLGRMVMHEKAEDPKIHDLQLDHLPMGTYLIQVMDEDHNLLGSEKIVLR